MTSAPARTMREEYFETIHSAPQGPADRPDTPAIWPTPPGLTMLNHGSYGLTPAYVRGRQDAFRARMDGDPVRFFKIDLEHYCDRARAALAGFMGCEAGDLAMVPNATFAMATLLNHLEFRAGDEIVVTDHEYNATLNELGRVCTRTGAALRWARLSLPLAGADQVVEAVMGAITDRTRLVVISHVASALGLVFPVERIVPLVRARGIDIIVDGAHAPGQVPVDLRSLAPTFYTGSCHKWLNTPKGSGFFYAERGRQDGIKPLALSCRVHKVRPERRAFLCDFDYVGTSDPTANLVIPDAIEHMRFQHPGGFEGVMSANRALAAAGGRLLRERLGLHAIAPDAMFASMQGLVLPPNPDPARASQLDDPLWDALLDRHAIQAPVWTHDPSGLRVLRISAQRYNEIGQYERLAEALGEELARERGQVKHPFPPSVKLRDRHPHSRC